MLEILQVSGLASIQDLGRTGWRKYGVPVSGPMDALAFQAANLLVGNSPDAAAMEIGTGELLMQATRECVIAVAGLGGSLSVQGREFPLWDSCFVRRGWTIQVNWKGAGMWSYLAVAGGFDIPAVLGSRSTFWRARLGGLNGNLLQAGDRLPVGQSVHSPAQLAARSLAEDVRPAYSQTPLIGVILGPQSDWFTSDSLEAFLSEPYQISPASDRMGYRLEGHVLRHQEAADLVSEGMLAGVVQVPADGRPIVMMADSPTAGGYPKIAAVTSVDLPLLAQCVPGAARIRFVQTTLEAARQRYRNLLEALKNGIVDSEQGGW